MWRQAVYLRNLISSFLVSLSVTIFEVVTLTSTPSTMNFLVFFNVFFCRLVSWHDKMEAIDAVYIHIVSVVFFSGR